MIIKKVFWTREHDRFILPAPCVLRWYFRQQCDVRVLFLDFSLKLLDAPSSNYLDFAASNVPGGFFVASSVVGFGRVHFSFLTSFLRVLRYFSRMARSGASFLRFSCFQSSVPDSDVHPEGLPWFALLCACVRIWHLGRFEPCMFFYRFKYICGKLPAKSCF